MTKPTKREQELVDILFEVAMHVNRKRKPVEPEKLGEWIRMQLSDCGFPCAPMGMSHGVLDKNQPN